MLTNAHIAFLLCTVDMCDWFAITDIYLFFLQAQDLKVNLINEDELFDLIKTRPGKKGKKPEASKSSKVCYY